MIDKAKNPPIQFHCTRKTGGCGARFTTFDYESHPYPEREWHPYNHVATCTKCGNHAEQASHQLAAWRSAVVGKSPEGLAAISAAQRERDPASYAASRFNALTHGATAETAKFYPARPGHYDQCNHCEFLTDGCGSAFQHCAKRTELFVQFAIAQEEGDGTLLGRLMASTQAGLMAITTDMMRSIAQRGVEIETPVYSRGENGIEVATYTDKDGKERPITKIEAHPLLFPLITFISKNNLTLGDMGLRPADKEEQAALKGFLDAKDSDRETLAEATRTQQDIVNNLLRVVGGNRVVNAGRVIDAPKEEDA